MRDYDEDERGGRNRKIDAYPLDLNQQSESRDDDFGASMEPGVIRQDCCLLRPKKRMETGSLRVCVALLVFMVAIIMTGCNASPDHSQRFYDYGLARWQKDEPHGGYASLLSGDASVALAYLNSVPALIVTDDTVPDFGPSDEEAQELREILARCSDADRTRYARAFARGYSEGFQRFSESAKGRKSAAILQELTSFAERIKDAMARVQRIGQLDVETRKLIDETMATDDFTRQAWLIELLTELASISEARTYVMEVVRRRAEVSTGFEHETWKLLTERLRSVEVRGR